MDRCHEVFVLVLAAGGLLADDSRYGRHASAAEVQFDVLPLVGCRDVTPDEFAAVNPHERLFEARFQVSSLLPRGDDEELVQYLIRIESPHRGFVVDDYLPQTTLATDVVKHLSVERSRENSNSRGVNVSGHYDQWLKGSATAGTGKTIKSSVRYDLLPPLESIASSGTVSRGGGVYFKLRPSRRTSLEGAKEFVLVLRVPRDWRGDYVRVTCEAVGRKQTVLSTAASESVWGSADVLVALYAEGDREAQQQAASMVAAEQELRETVRRAQSEVRRLASPHMHLKLGRLPRFSEPKMSRDDVDRFLERPERDDLRRVHQLMPVDVREVLAAYASAKFRLRKLNGGETVLARTADTVAADQWRAVGDDR